jgi:ProQ/FINO family
MRKLKACATASGRTVRRRCIVQRTTCPPVWLEITNTKQRLRPPVHSASHRRHTQEPHLWARIRSAELLRSPSKRHQPLPRKRSLEARPPPFRLAPPGLEPATEREPPAGPQGPCDAAAARIAAWLAATYPAAFGLNGDVKPVAIGVGKLIWPAAKAAGIGRRALNDALSRRSGSPAYLEALAADGAVRIDLDGAVVEPVGLEHQVNALDRLAKIERRRAGKGAGR